MNRWEWEGMGMLKAIPARLYSKLKVLGRCSSNHCDGRTAGRKACFSRAVNVSRLYRYSETEHALVSATLLGADSGL